MKYQIRQQLLYVLRRNHNRWMSCKEISVILNFTYKQVYYAINSIESLCVFEKKNINSRNVVYREYV